MDNYKVTVYSLNGNTAEFELLLDQSDVDVFNQHFTKGYERLRLSTSRRTYAINLENVVLVSFEKCN